MQYCRSGVFDEVTESKNTVDLKTKAIKFILNNPEIKDVVATRGRLLDVLDNDDVIVMTIEKYKK